MCVERADLNPKAAWGVHIYLRGHLHQLSFEDFFLPFGGKLAGDDRWIKLAELIPWDELEDDYAAEFCRAHQQNHFAWRWVHHHWLMWRCGVLGGVGLILDTAYKGHRLQQLIHCW